MEVKATIRTDIPFQVGGIYAMEFHGSGGGWRFFLLVDDGAEVHTFERYALVEVDSGRSFTEKWVTEDRISKILEGNGAIYCPEAKLHVVVNKRPTPEESHSS